MSYGVELCGCSVWVQEKETKYFLADFYSYEKFFFHIKLNLVV